MTVIVRDFRPGDAEAVTRVRRACLPIEVMTPESVLSTVVMVDGEVAAYTAAMTDGGTRYLSGMTGTLRAHRGKWYARLAKTEPRRRARAAGHTDAFMGDDGGNRPTRAINKWSGYEICASEVHHVRTLD